MSNVVISIAVAEIRDDLSNIDGLENRLTEAMKKMRNHWMCTDENEQFKAAVSAVMVSYDEDSPERTRLEKELKKVNQTNAALNAAIAGVPVDFAAMIDNEEDDFEPIGVMEIWRNSKEAS
jgi:hypothetical protein